MRLTHYFYDLAALLFPPVCAGCQAPLTAGEQHICAACWYHLPYTHFHRDPANRGAKQFWGRIPLTGVAAYLYFCDASRVQRIVHQLKYRNRPDLGVLLGRRFGDILRNTPPFNGVDCIIPVPLHVRKLRRRGYNQSAYFARGLADIMQKPVIENNLIQCRQTPSQTKKDRYQRIENNRKAFKVVKPELLSGKHILLVDDVLTTGATIEACAAVLLADPSVRISVATLAHAV